MSYRKSWTKTFKSTDFNDPVDVPITLRAPIRCTEHMPRCFKASDSYRELATRGLWKLRSPIDIQTEMPGDKQKVLMMMSYGLAEFGFGTAVREARADIILVADEMEKYRYSNLSHGGQWTENTLEPNLSIEGYSKLDVRLFQSVSVWTGGGCIHDADIKVDCEYYSYTPPATASVRLTVSNRETGVLVKRAYVALMSGAIVVADGYTDGGEVIFKNVNEGSYTIKVKAGGYYDFDQSIDVTPPSVWYVIKIVPIPIEPIPDWVKYVVVGLSALGAITIIPAVIRRKPEEKVIVVGK